MNAASIARMKGAMAALAAHGWTESHVMCTERGKNMPTGELRLADQTPRVVMKLPGTNYRASVGFGSVVVYVLPSYDAVRRFRSEDVTGLVAFAESVNTVTEPKP